MRSPSREREVVCPCGTTFKTRHSQGKYCSEACAHGGELRSWQRYGKRNRPRRRLYHRAHYIVNRETILKRTTAYHRTPTGRAAQRRNDERQRQKFPEKYAARQAVFVALRAGRLTRQPCARCGDPKTQAHHHDYAKPLDVIWLCQRHHDIEGGRAAQLPMRGAA